MRKMKDSGIDWIGEIPLEKRVIRNKYKLVYTKGKIPTETNEEMKGVPYIGATDLDSSNGYSLYTEDDTVPECYKNDLLVLWDGARAGLAGNNKCGKISSTIVKITADNSVYSPFLYWYYKGFEKYMYQCVNGTTIPHMNKKYIEDIGLLDWTYEEQINLSEYLDEKCGKIDAVIEKQQAIIEKLKEYKMSLITEAVTKGLDPDVPMKDSGIEFIGEIPERWNVTKLGMLFEYIGGNAYNSDCYISESENQIVRIGNVKNGFMALENNPVYIDNKTAVNTAKFRIRQNTILFTMTGTKGKRDYFYTQLVTEKDTDKKNLYLNQRVGCLIPKVGVDAGYYNYLLKDRRILDSIFLYETGTANQGNLGIESIKRTKLQLPPLEEQIEIRKKLNKICDRKMQIQLEHQ